MQQFYQEAPRQIPIAYSVDVLVVGSGPAGFAAAVGLISVFCGAVNCPLASIFLSVELFGDGGLLYFAVACGLSYLLSGYSGLYSSQTILYSKLKAQYINVHTNAHHASDPPAAPAASGEGRES